MLSDFPVKQSHGLTLEAAGYHNVKWHIRYHNGTIMLNGTYG